MRGAKGVVSCIEGAHAAAVVILLFPLPLAAEISNHKQEIENSRLSLAPLQG